MQHQPGVRPPNPAEGPPVEGIAEDRHPRLGQVDADLVLAPGEGPGFQNDRPAQGLAHGELRAGRLGDVAFPGRALRPPRHCGRARPPRHAATALTDERPRRPRTRGGSAGRPRRHHVVDLLDLALREGLRQPGVGPRVLDEEDDARGVAIEALVHAQGQGPAPGASARKASTARTRLGREGRRWARWKDRPACPPR